MKRKTNKKSGIIAAVVGLSAVSLVSVGFASWVMSGGDTTSIEGTIEVDTVDDKRFLIGDKSLSYGDEDGKDVKGNAASKIVYGIDDTLSVTNHWLGVGASDNKYENLDAKLTFYVANAPTAANIQVTFAPKAGATATAWQNALDANLVAAPTIGTPSISDGGSKTIQGITGNCKKVEVSVHFNWGTAFGEINPYKYFNDQDYSVDLSDEAKTKLQNLNTYLTNMVYVLTITTKVA